MNRTFTDKVAEHLIARHGANLSDVCVVIPSHRAKYYVMDSLRRNFEKSFWTPRFFVLPELVQWLSGRRTGSPLELSLGFYQSYRTTSGNPEKFASFMKWAAVAMRDFNDVDSALADPKRIFSDLRNIREIEGWSFAQPELSQAQLSYLEFWDRLGDLYHAFAQWQEENHCRTYHRMVRDLAENDLQTELLKGIASFYVAGVASFSRAEKRMFEILGNHIPCEILWDLDQYYLEDEMHEAGTAARQFQIDRSGPWVDNQLGVEPKEIFIHECNTSAGQLMRLSGILKERSLSDLSKSCIVITDESLLDPLISCLPQLGTEINIASGIPVAASNAAKWVQSVLTLRLGDAKNGRGFYHKQLAQFLQLSRVIGLAQTEIDEVSRRMISEVWVYVTHRRTKELVADYPTLQFMEALLLEPDSRTLPRLIAHFLDKLELADERERIACGKLKEALTEMEGLLMRYDYLNDPESVLSLYSTIAAKDTIHYKGDPGENLQVLSMVETRALDFNCVFILGCNEDMLPGSSMDQSYIPLDLRSFYKLPLPSEKEAMYAYTFYRLLQRSDEVHLFYSTVSSDFRSTEQSRYLTQIEQELAVKNPNIRIHRKIVSAPETIFRSQRVFNDEFCRSRLDEMFSSGISPSALNTYINCPLDFYYKYIIGLGEDDTIEEQMSAATFGSIVHHVLEKFYEEFIGRDPEEQDFVRLETELDIRIGKALEQEYSSHQGSEGFNLLAGKIAIDMLLRYIRCERENISERMKTGVSRKIVDVEKVLHRMVDVEKHEWSKPVVLKGKADRIDMEGEQVVIIDYKTGAINRDDIVFNNVVGELFLNFKKSKQRQLLSYIYMYLGNGGDPQKIRAGFYSFINHEEGLQFLENKSGGMDQSVIDNFELALMNWVKSVYATEYFEHDHASRYCNYCRTGVQ